MDAFWVFNFFNIALNSTSQETIVLIKAINTNNAYIQGF